jgi:hypothetical protein
MVLPVYIHKEKLMSLTNSKLKSQLIFSINQSINQPTGFDDFSRHGKRGGKGQ